MGLFGEKHTPQTECGPSQKVNERETGNMMWLVFNGLAIS